MSNSADHSASPAGRDSRPGIHLSFSKDIDMAADIATALRDLLTGTASLDQLIVRHFTPDYRQRTNGVVDDADGFAAHIAHLRGLVRHVDIEVLAEISEGLRYSSHHRVTIEKTDGSRSEHEVYLFADRASDGRFRVVDEVTLMLHGDDADRDLGSAR
jgi:hypothetical protein